MPIILKPKPMLIGLLLFAYALLVSLLGGAQLTLPRVLTLLGFSFLLLAWGVWSLSNWSRFIVVGGVMSIGAFVYARTGATWAAWGVAGGWMMVLSGIGGAIRLDSRLRQSLMWGFLAFATGFVPVALAQIESRFSEEEFFAALQVLALSGYFLLMMWATRWVIAPPRPGGSAFPAWVGVVPLAICLCVGIWAVREYQRSFFSPDVPPFEGISTKQPFICGTVPPSSQTYEGTDVFEEYLALVAANPDKGTAELGMLALGTGDIAWAERFRIALLDEASQGLYTGPANSVKSVQMDAAIRAYYYAKVSEAFPGLFAREESALSAWFAAINRRALKVEWVDWLYALAFSKWPEGLYENQENGAGLLATLAWAGLEDPERVDENIAYLTENPRGWHKRFRNTDDAYIYQAVWMINAYFQMLPETPSEQTRKMMTQAFEWLLLQSLPDAGGLTYNHPLVLNPAGAAYLGATLTHDPRLMWLAGRGVETSGETKGVFYTFPGVDSALSLTGISPKQGSCLLYGDSGLPNQFGPLAPDKIIFRDGWERDSMYMLLNLRFTGWHRYKGTNTISLVYQGEPLVADALVGEPVWWLPLGRSHFRDKRIPRENLSGFVVERSGMGAVLYGLTGMGGPWTQDPPFYARVVRFEPGDVMDVSVTTLEGWRWWTHKRAVYFVHEGPIVIVDRAEGQGQAGVVWQVLGEPVGVDRFRLGEEDAGEMVLLPVGDVVVSWQEMGEGRGQAWLRGEDVVRGLTIILPKGWAGADVSIVGEEAVIQLGEKEIRVEVAEQ